MKGLAILGVVLSYGLIIGLQYVFAAWFRKSRSELTFYAVMGLLASLSALFLITLLTAKYF